MNEADLRNLLQRYDLRQGHDPVAPAEVAYFAYYSEMPGCVAQAGSQPQAIAELASISLPFLQLILREGGQLEIPFRERIPVSEIKGMVINGASLIAANTKTSLTGVFNLRRETLRNVAMLPQVNDIVPVPV